jgi:hypothetical protein
MRRRRNYAIRYARSEFRAASESDGIVSAIREIAADLVCDSDIYDNAVAYVMLFSKKMHTYKKINTWSVRGLLVLAGKRSRKRVKWTRKGIDRHTRAYRYFSQSYREFIYSYNTPSTAGRFCTGSHRPRVRYLYLPIRLYRARYVRLPSILRAH